MKRKGKSLTTKRKSFTRKKNTRKQKAEREYPSKAKGDDFLTEIEHKVPERMLATNSVNMVCGELRISRSRYYEIMRNIVKKWGMSWQTQNYLNGIYIRAKKQKNLLARHLTQVKRVELLEPTISQPQRIETTLEGQPIEGEPIT